MTALLRINFVKKSVINFMNKDESLFNNSPGPGKFSFFIDLKALSYLTSLYHQFLFSIFRKQLFEIFVIFEYLCSFIININPPDWSIAGHRLLFHSFIAFVLVLLKALFPNVVSPASWGSSSISG